MKRLFRTHFSWWTRKLEQDAVDACAAQASFWLLIACIPFILFVLTLLRAVQFRGEPVLFAFCSLLPAPARELLLQLFSDLRIPPGLLSASALLCVWSASNGTLSILRGLHAVFSVPRRYGFIRMRISAIFYTLAFAAVLPAGLMILLFGRHLYLRLRTVLPALPDLSAPVRMACGFLCLFVFCWLMFVAVPRRQVRARFALFGAVFSALGWLLFSFFFSLFVENFANYATLYGGLAAVVILMMWLYFCMYILLLGGETAMWLQHSSLRQDLRTLYSARRRHFVAQKGRPHGKHPTKKH